ncbi:hypothetical protein TNCV_730811 [Trichonephila clavipes]|nr:hypothetical protein TNCV_730811 [Trichonephila clavipes]
MGKPQMREKTVSVAPRQIFAENIPHLHFLRYHVSRKGWPEEEGKEQREISPAPRWKEMSAPPEMVPID